MSVRFLRDNAALTGALIGLAILSAINGILHRLASDAPEGGLIPGTQPPNLDRTTSSVRLTTCAPHYLRASPAALTPYAVSFESGFTACSQGRRQRIYA